MRGVCLSVAVVTASVNAQVPVKLVIPHEVGENQTDAGLRQRIQRIIGRDVRLRFEYELFVKDLTALGRQAVPHILELVDRDVTDRYVTESLLRIGGPDVRRWLEGVLTHEDPDWRQAFMSGVPPVVHVHSSVRPELARFVHDKSPEVRILAVRRFHTLVPAYEMLTRCRDMNREVVRVAIEIVSDRWLFLDHGDRELQNLAKFIGILEMHQRDDRWQIGRGFTKALHKERIASTKSGRELLRRTAELPWFSKGVGVLTARQLESIRGQLQEPNTIVQAVLTKTLRDMQPAAGAELLLVLADDSDAKVRLAACNAGLTLLDPELASAFVRFLKDPDPKIRARARELLEQTAFYTDQQRRWHDAKRL